MEQKDILEVLDERIEYAKKRKILADKNADWNDYFYFRGQISIAEEIKTMFEK